MASGTMRPSVLRTTAGSASLPSQRTTLLGHAASRVAVARRRGFVGTAVRLEGEYSPSFYGPINVRCGDKKKEKRKEKKGCGRDTESVVARATVLENVVADMADGASTPTHADLLKEILKEVKALRTDIKSLKAMAMKGDSSSSSSSSSSSEDDMPPSLAGARTRGPRGKQAMRGAENSLSEFKTDVPRVNVCAVQREIIVGGSEPVAAASLSNFLPSRPQGPMSPFDSLPHVNGVYSIEDIVAAVSSASSSVAVPPVLQEARVDCPPPQKISVEQQMPLQDSPMQTRRETYGAADSEEQICGIGAIQVCMGGKCKKAGGAEILSALQEAAGRTGISVESRAKCMGKCKMAPNVKVWREGDSMLESMVAAGEARAILEGHFPEVFGKVAVAIAARDDVERAIA